MSQIQTPTNMNKKSRKNSTHRRIFRKCHADESSKGFTLVELLVVLVTIAVLALTLIPAFASAKPNNLALQCMNNLRQWGSALRTMASDNTDMIARDGTDNSGQYAVDSGPITGPGSPIDQYAWFNIAPAALAEKPFSNYWNTPGGNPQSHLPFPGGQGKIWHCPAARAAATDTFLQNGTYGFFSYVMNIDLKTTAPIGASISRLAYPSMPKFGAIRNPSAQVLFTDVAFSPTLEPLASPSDSDRNGVFPAARSYTFPSRHSGGGTLLFIDGHSAIYKRSYVTNGAPNNAGANRAEKNNPDIWWNPNRIGAFN